MYFGSLSLSLSSYLGNSGALMHLPGHSAPSTSLVVWPRCGLVLPTIRTQPLIFSFITRLICSLSTPYRCTDTPICVISHFLCTFGPIVVFMFALPIFYVSAWKQSNLVVPAFLFLLFFFRFRFVYSFFFSQ